MISLQVLLLRDQVDCATARTFSDCPDGIDHTQDDHCNGKHTARNLSQSRFLHANKITDQIQSCVPASMKEKGHRRRHEQFSGASGSFIFKPVSALIELPSDMHGDEQSDDYRRDISKDSLFDDAVHQADQPRDHDIVDLACQF